MNRFWTTGLGIFVALCCTHGALDAQRLSAQRKAEVKQPIHKQSVKMSASGHVMIPVSLADAKNPQIPLPVVSGPSPFGATCTVTGPGVCALDIPGGAVQEDAGPGGFDCAPDGNYVDTNGDIVGFDNDVNGGCFNRVDADLDGLPDNMNEQFSDLVGNGDTIHGQITQYASAGFGGDEDGDGLTDEDPSGNNYGVSCDACEDGTTCNLILADDDGDGLVDEDEPDGIDDDGDGMEGEDSADEDGDGLIDEDGVPVYFRDHDWYRFSVTQVSNVSFSFRSNFLADTFTFTDADETNGPIDCDDGLTCCGSIFFFPDFSTGNVSGDCSTVDISYVIPPGDYVLDITTDGSTDDCCVNPCGGGANAGNDYVIENFLIEPLPTNDSCQDSFVLDGTAVFQTNFGSNTDIDQDCSDNDNQDVFFRYTAPAPGSYTVSTCNSNPAGGDTTDTVLSVYNTQDCDALLADPAAFQVACNDDAFCGAGPFLSEATFDVASPLGPNNYMIQVSGFGGTQGQGLLTITSDAAPANDLPQNAIDVSAGGDFTFNNVNAGSDVDAACSGGDSADVWYVYTADVDGILNVSTCSSTTFCDTVVAIYDGASIAYDDDAAINAAFGPGAATNTAGCSEDSCGDGNCPGFQFLSLAQAQVSGGNSYLIQVAGFAEEGEGTMNIDFDPLPPNDLCANARAVGTGIHAFNSLGATTDFTQDACINPGGGSNAIFDVWFEYTAATTGDATIGTCDPSGAGVTPDTIMAVYNAGVACPTEQNLADVLGCADDTVGCAGGGSPDYGSQVTVAVEAGNSYLVQVSDWGGFSVGAGFLTIENSGAPANDLCTNATAIGEGSHEFDSTGAGADVDQSCSTNDGNHVWFSYTPSADGIATLSTVNSAVLTDTIISIYLPGAGCNPSPDDEYACSEDISGGNFLSELCVTVEGGNEYLVEMGTWGGEEGVGTLDITLDAGAGIANDFCADATPVDVGLNDIANVCATDDGPNLTGFCDAFADGINHLNTWHTFTAPNAGDFIFTTCDLIDFDSRLAVYDDTGVCPPAPGDLVGCNDDDDVNPCGGAGSFHSTLTVPLVSGNSYLVEVGGFSAGDSGSGQLSIEPDCLPVVDLAGTVDPTIGPETALVAAGEGSVSGGSDVVFGWDFDGDGVEDAAGAMASFKYTVPGSYDVSLTGSNVCSSETVVVATVSVVGIGDFNNDGMLALGDAVDLANFLFVPGSPGSACNAAMDWNASGSLNLVDVVANLNNQFTMGPAAVLPANGVLCDDVP